MLIIPHSKTKDVFLLVGAATARCARCTLYSFVYCTGTGTCTICALCSVRRLWGMQQ